MKEQRIEASTEVSEFNLNEVGKEKVKLNDLLKTLKPNKRSHVTVKNQLKSATKKRALQVPLSKPQAEKINRGVAYEKVSEEVCKWDAVVRANRVADQLIFPLKKPEFRLETTEEISKRFQTKNALEEEVAALLGSSENVLDQQKPLTVAEEKALKAMDLAEARARLEELKKTRMLLSHQEAKARRQGKIKSKRYHRILKRERMRKMMKEFEELQKIDPAAAEEKLKEADSLRILERMTLKHRNTGKWAKQQKLRAKYNTESRDALKEQISLSHSLTEKIIPIMNPTEVITEDVDDHDVEDGDLLNLYLSNSAVDPEKVKAAKQSSRKQPAKQVTFVNEEVKEKDKAVPEIVPDLPQDDTGLDEIEERRQDIEDFECNGVSEESQALPIAKEPQEKVAKEVSKQPAASAGYVVEPEFTSAATILQSLIPDDISSGDEGLDDNEEGRMNIAQAFADDDLISEFRAEKKTVSDKEKPEGIDLFLPGWGSWGGAGIRENKRKRKRFYIEPPKGPPRKDSTLGNVIISEEKDKKASIHQVSEIPFPFSSVDQFQSVIRQPIGNTWNPESSFQKMIAPKIVTKLGKIIDPIDAEDAVMEKAKGGVLKRKGDASKLKGGASKARADAARQKGDASKGKGNASKGKGNALTGKGDASKAKGFGLKGKGIASKAQNGVTAKAKNFQNANSNRKTQKRK